VAGNLVSRTEEESIMHRFLLVAIADRPAPAYGAPHLSRYKGLISGRSRLV
jgi:hypothetical protein